MSKRQIFAAAVAAVALTVAGVAASGTPAQAEQQVERPFRYVSDGTISNEELPCGGFVFLPGGEPNFLCEQDFAGIDERATHLGRTTSTATGLLAVYVARSCTTPLGGTGVRYESNTDRIIVAANGDELYVSTNVSGCSDGENVTEPVGTYTVTGGTGRFDGATGGGVVSSSVADGSISAIWTGTVTY